MGEEKSDEFQTSVLFCVSTPGHNQMNEDQICSNSKFLNISSLRNIHNLRERRQQGAWIAAFVQERLEAAFLSEYDKVVSQSANLCTLLLMPYTLFLDSETETFLIG